MANNEINFTLEIIAAGSEAECPGVIAKQNDEVIAEGYWNGNEFMIDCEGGHYPSEWEDSSAHNGLTVYGERALNAIDALCGEFFN